MNNEIDFGKYPEGWEYAKSLLTFVPEKEREAFMVGYCTSAGLF